MFRKRNAIHLAVCLMLANAISIFPLFMFDNFLLTLFFDTCQDRHCRRGRLPIWRAPAHMTWKLADNAAADGLEKIPDLILRDQLGFSFCF